MFWLKWLSQSTRLYTFIAQSLLYELFPGLILPNVISFNKSYLNGNILFHHFYTTLKTVFLNDDDIFTFLLFMETLKNSRFLQEILFFDWKYDFYRNRRKSCRTYFLWDFLFFYGILILIEKHVTCHVKHAKDKSSDILSRQ